MRYRIPAGALVLLVGPSGAGKSTWVTDTLAREGLPDDVAVSSDTVRVALFGTDTVQDQPERVFGIVHEIVEGRLIAGNTTVVDATNLLERDRAPLLELARRLSVPTVAIRFPVKLDELVRRNEARDNPRPERVLTKHVARMESHGSPNALAKEFDEVVACDHPVAFAPYGPDAAAAVTGPLAVIGDVHGSAKRLADLLAKIEANHPDATLVYVGDLGDRGEDTPGVYRTVREQVTQGRAHMVRSNHGDALVRKAGRRLDKGLDAIGTYCELSQQATAAEDAGKPQPATRMSAETVAQFAALEDGDEQLAAAIALEKRCPHQLLLDNGRVLVVHGGVTPETFGRDDGNAVQVALYGTPTGPVDPDSDVDTRDSWVETWCQARDADPSLPLVVYGHIAYDTPRVTDHTIGVDTGAGKEQDAPVTAVIVDDGEPIGFLQA